MYPEIWKKQICISKGGQNLSTMHDTLLLACIMSFIYIAACNSRLPDETPKSDGSQSAVDLEPVPDQLDSTLISSEEDPEKRGWDKLSNVWGKRADWNKLNGMWGKRADWNKLNGMWGKRADWNKLNGMWGKRADWNKLNGMWGKRADWNKLNGMWGKRADWNKLNGMWGKRETTELPPYWGKRGWNNLSNVWGKRTSSRDDGSKRTTQWNNLKSVWGKRGDSEWDIPAVWEGIPVEDNFQGIYIPDQM
ncbi:Prothoracicostatic peptide like protein [Argiope bruennichi]|uniref:Prothoracicostatic peptide like protein n=2 Tax=Argiope bruennichi TaxID=94029 RepID=A0A8T0EBD8_ARGBR|nr:Prothoracicostatic peptide like protein [Argiope bruennichi]